MTKTVSEVLAPASGEKRTHLLKRRSSTDWAKSKAAAKGTGSSDSRESAPTSVPKAISANELRVKRKKRLSSSISAGWRPRQ